MTSPNDRRPESVAGQKFSPVPTRSEMGPDRTEPEPSGPPTDTADASFRLAQPPEGQPPQEETGYPQTRE